MKKHDIQPFETRGRWRVIVPRDLSAKRQTKWFKSKAQAQSFAGELMAQRGELGRGFHSLSKIDQGLILKALAKAGSAEAVLDSVDFWKAQRPEKIITLSDLIARCVGAKEKNESAYYCRCLKNTLAQFLKLHPDAEAHSIQPHDIDDFVNADSKWATETRRTYLRDLTTLFSYAQRHGYVVINPAKNAEKIKPEDTRIPILTVAEAERMMRAAEKTDRGLIYYLALCLFGGLRPSEALRVQIENIRDGHIEVFGKKVRARNRRLVTINPTLRAWLNLDTKFSTKNLAKRMRKVSTGIEWRQDIMRHSFVSYHFAIHSAEETSKEAGHSETVLFRNYRELVTTDEANRFWAIKPTSLVVA